MDRSLAFVMWAGVMIAAFVIGMRFRAGKHRSFVALYRNRSLPAVYRNLPLVGPVLAVSTVPILIVGGVMMSGVSVPIHLERRLVGFLLFLAWAVLFAGVGTSGVFTFAPPRWLVPRWLRDEDAAARFAAPPSDRFDWATLAVGVFMLAAAALAVVVAVLQLAAQA